MNKNPAREAAWQQEKEEEEEEEEEEVEGDCWPWHCLFQIGWGPGLVLFLGQDLPCAASPGWKGLVTGRVALLLGLPCVCMSGTEKYKLLKAKEDEDTLAGRL